MPTIETYFLRDKLTQVFFEETGKSYRLLTTNGRFFDVDFASAPGTANRDLNLERKALQVKCGRESIASGLVTVTFEPDNVSIMFSWLDSPWGNRLPGSTGYREIMDIYPLSH